MAGQGFNRLPRMLSKEVQRRAFYCWYPFSSGGWSYLEGTSRFFLSNL